MSMDILSTSLSPRAGVLLTQVTETTDFDAALWKLLTDYMELKIKVLGDEVRVFEHKWGMNFATFTAQMADGTLPSDAYSFEVEQDFWQWEKTETLLNYYRGLRTQWM
jgi:hypothetical protein